MKELCISPCLPELSSRAAKTARNLPGRMSADYVYMLTDRSQVVLCTRVTNDLAQRVWEHQNRARKGITKKYRLTLLVYHESQHDIRQAIDREKEIKAWRRSRKNALVESLNPRRHDLSRTLDQQREILRRPLAAPDDNFRVASSSHPNRPPL
jgi:putative endonuclease